MTDNTQNEVSRTGAGLDLDGIEARCDKATPAPWVNFDPNAVLGVDAPEGGVVAWTYHRGNTNFIAHARTDVPALLEEVRRLRAVLVAADTLCANVLGYTGTEGAEDWVYEVDPYDVLKLREAVKRAAISEEAAQSGQAQEKGEQGEQDV